MPVPALKSLDPPGDAAIGGSTAQRGPSVAIVKKLYRNLTDPAHVNQEPSYADKLTDPAQIVNFNPVAEVNFSSGGEFLGKLAAAGKELPK
jgi:hypothetical protein